MLKHSSLPQQYIPTVEDTYVGIVETERGTREKLRFYDTAGLDAQHRNLPQHYHALADGYVLVYSVADSLSFQLLTDLKKDIDRHKEKKDVRYFLLFFLTKIYKLISKCYERTLCICIASLITWHRSIEK